MRRLPFLFCFFSLQAAASREKNEVGVEKAGGVGGPGVRGQSPIGGCLRRGFFACLSASFFLFPRYSRKVRESLVDGGGGWSWSGSWLARVGNVAAEG